MTHIISANQFSRDDILSIFNETKKIKHNLLKKPDKQAKKSKGVALLFFQPSTRTHSSFQIAAQMCNIPVVYSSQDAQHASSFAKGESLEDTIRYFCETYSSIIGTIILRHPDNFASRTAAMIAERYGISIINAGDNEHPTQALIDLYTIWEKNNEELDNINLAVCNDLEKSRTIHSLCMTISNCFDVKVITACAPNGVYLPNSIQKLIGKNGIEILYIHDLKEAALKCDFLYMTRPQKEYYKDKKQIKRFQNFRIDKDFLENLPIAKACYIMHPMPIDRQNFNEITSDAANHPRSIIFQQAANGLPIRMALLKRYFGG